MGFGCLFVLRLCTPDRRLSCFQNFRPSEAAETFIRWAASGTESRMLESAESSILSLGYLRVLKVLVLLQSKLEIQLTK